MLLCNVINVDGEKVVILQMIYFAFQKTIGN